MMNWVRAGAYCICIDENWEDDSGEEVQGPLIDEIHIVTGWHWDSGEICIRILGWPSDFSFAASAFRPFNREEGDMTYFSTFLTDSTAPSRALEPSCSS